MHPIQYGTHWSAEGSPLAGERDAMCVFCFVVVDIDMEESSRGDPRQERDARNIVCGTVSVNVKVMGQSLGRSLASHSASFKRTHCDDVIRWLTVLT